MAACEDSGPIENFQVTVGFKVRSLEHHQYHLLEKQFLGHQLRFTRQDSQEASLCPKNVSGGSDLSHVRKLYPPNPSYAHLVIRICCMTQTKGYELWAVAIYLAGLLLFFLSLEKGTRGGLSPRNEGYLGI